MKKISKHITYKEATHSNTAIRLGIKNEPKIDQLDAMKYVANMVFEPARSHFNKPIRINSFFRSVTLNNKIGGSSSSQHCKGEAIDMDAIGFSNEELFNYIKDNLKFDQLINEYNYSWIHVSYKLIGKNRNMVMKADRIDGKTKYTIV